MFNIGILKNYVFKGAYSKVERSFWECCFVSFFLSVVVFKCII